MSEADRKILEQFLPAIPVFSRVSLPYLRQILDDFTFSRAKEGKIIICQGDTTSDLYVILKGKVKVILVSEEGEEFVLNEQRAGDFFGEVSLIDGKPRSATVMAAEECSFGVLRRARLLDLINREPQIAVDLLSSLTYRLRKATAREQQLAFLDVRERLCRFLMQAALEEGVKEADGYFRVRKRTHKDLSTRIGASREAVTKILKSLASEELVRELKGSTLVSPRICGEGPR